MEAKDLEEQSMKKRIEQVEEVTLEQIIDQRESLEEVKVKFHNQ